MMTSITMNIACLRNTHIVDTIDYVNTKHFVSTANLSGLSLRSHLLKPTKTVCVSISALSSRVYLVPASGSKKGTIKDLRE